MTELRFGVVDVFAERPLEGNPLAVVEGGEALPDETLSAIAKEFNQSETTFVQRPVSAEADRRLRSFTAGGVEVFGAGHNALGAWLWLAYQGRLGALDQPASFRQEIGGVVLPLRLERRSRLIYGTMAHAPLVLDPFRVDVTELAAALALTPGDFEPEPAPRVAFTGAAHLLVRVRDRATVDRAEPDGAALARAMGSKLDRGCYIYALEAVAGTPAAYARFFNPSVGLHEDPATGSAAGPLGAYLLRSGLIPENARLQIEQGTRMGRRSLLTVAAAPVVELSGSGVMVMEGRLHLAAP